MSAPTPSDRDMRALLALYGHRDHATLEVLASQAQLLRAASMPATTWQTYAIPSLVSQGLLTAERTTRGHYVAMHYTLTPLGVQVAKSAPMPQSETPPNTTPKTTPRGGLGVVSESSRGRTLNSSSFLSLLEGTKKEEPKETTPRHDPETTPNPVGVDPATERLLAQALHLIAEQQKTIQGLMAKAGLVAEACSCGQVKVERTNGKTGEKFKACPLFKKCPHYVKAESPAVESARRASQAARETAARLQKETGPQKVDPFSVLPPRRVS